MQATQSNNASGKRGLASPFAAPIEAARKYLDRQRGERLPGAATELPDLSDVSHLPGAPRWEAESGSEGGLRLGTPFGGNAAIFQDFEDGSSGCSSDAAPIEGGLRRGEELLFEPIEFDPIERAGEGRRAWEELSGEQPGYPEDDRRHENGRDAGGPVFTFEPSLAAPDPKEVRAAIFRLSRESKVPQWGSAGSAARSRLAAAQEVLPEKADDQNLSAFLESRFEAAHLPPAEKTTALSGGPSSSKQPLTTPSSETRQSAAGIAPSLRNEMQLPVQKDVYRKVDSRNTLAQDSQDENQDRNTQPMAFADVARLLWAPGAAAATAASFTPEGDDADLAAGERKEALDVPTSPYGNPFPTHAPQAAAQDPNQKPELDGKHEAAAEAATQTMCGSVSLAGTASQPEPGPILSDVASAHLAAAMLGASEKPKREGPSACPALAHDANNLLSALRLYSELLGFGDVLNPKHLHYAEDLKLLADRSRELIERLLEQGAGQGPRRAASSAVAHGEETPTTGELDSITAARSGNDELRIQERARNIRPAPEPQSRPLPLGNEPHRADMQTGVASSIAPIAKAVYFDEAGPTKDDTRGSIRRFERPDDVEGPRAVSAGGSAATGALPPPRAVLHTALTAQTADGEGPPPGTDDSATANLQEADSAAESPVRTGAARTNLVDLLLRWGSLLSTLAHGALEVRFGARAAVPIAVEAEAIERILVNLVRNAAAAIRNGGAIRIGVGIQGRGGTAPLELPEGSEVMVLTVDDSGDGMTAPQVDRALGREENPAAEEAARQRLSLIGYPEPCQKPRHDPAERFVSGYGSWPGCRLDGKATEGQTAQTEWENAAGEATRDFIHEIDDRDGVPTGVLSGLPGVPRHGLGLAIVRGLVRSSGGTLSIHSRPGLGTRIEMRWPTAKAEIPCAETNAEGRLAAAKAGGTWVSDVEGVESVELQRRSARPSGDAVEGETRAIDRQLPNAAPDRNGSEARLARTQFGVGREGAIAC